MSSRKEKGATEKEQRKEKRGNAGGGAKRTK